ncbi:MAG: segregation/condensation protein A [Gemmatimonadetes bacterium]|uniref:Segregation and condensation protein A n=1 Tax=Candidatus Kutchimonas denitrificans TaxID=3056748 RepID=A0AAE5CCQ8_9BACT|nr:segregation/condensation protein A [Gemmatimonadota bacterium]NIR76005.1 segregation/condensation protein A [Candidatus Kutchimonas denitrificans]NIS02197.1 segregation/condensation protein A [Gemmatimonadota bacterium]NIT68023.1 segregation/condensation protein A [Gemmatimonadota bacterium]NIU54049.1 segregation/condensation protein A [Gemmatimonadota bacterium]
MRLPAPSRSRAVEADDRFIVELERFQGPLDLLLHLIRSQDIDIFDIPIAEITEQFVRLIEGVEERLSLEEAGEFLEMAATLVRIKAQMLLPRRDDLLEDEDPRSELVRRLLEYEFFREMAYTLADAEADRARHRNKGYIEPRRPPDVSELPLELSLDDFLAVAVSLPAPPVRTPHRAPVRPVTVDEKVDLWLRALKEKARVPFEWFMRRWRTRIHAVMSFLAALELAKRGSIRLRQERHFGTLWVYRGEGDEDS